MSKTLTTQTDFQYNQRFHFDSDVSFPKLFLFLIGNNSKKVSETIKKYAELSSIQGVAYIFESRRPVAQKIYWTTTVCLMFIMGLYWSANIFMNWNENQVLTTIRSASDMKVEFPSVTFCSQGKLCIFLYLFFSFLIFFAMQLKIK